MILSMTRICTLAAALACGLGLTSAASAAPLSPLPPTTIAGSVQITDVALGCGPGFTRGRFGRCRPSFGPRRFYGRQRFHGPRGFRGRRHLGPRRFRL